MENKDLRKRIVEQAYKLGLKHVGSALSCIDFVSHLYSTVLKKDDIFIMSKGHGSMALYSVLEKQGKEVDWNMHPELNEQQGIYATTGSLGHGLPISLGRAFAKKAKNSNGKVYTLLGDCEMSEGSIWESLIIADSLDIDNLNLFIDWNKYGATSSVKNSLNFDKNSLVSKLQAFGCKAQVIDGHNSKELGLINHLGPGRNAVILDTVKGKGIKSLEESHAHSFYIKEEKEYKKIIRELS